jgi:hypothetical protein
MSTVDGSKPGIGEALTVVVVENELVVVVVTLVEVCPGLTEVTYNPPTICPQE